MANTTTARPATAELTADDLDRILTALANLKHERIEAGVNVADLRETYDRCLTLWIASVPA